jgi:GntR family transcriptional regulator, carbon starvation induced regulator
MKEQRRRGRYKETDLVAAPRQRPEPVGSSGKSPLLGTHYTLAEVAANEIRAHIVAGQLVPGARIHLHSMATALNMSPIPVREALSSLAAEGLIDFLPRRGYRVGRLTVADLDDTLRLRYILDPLAVELAVPNLTEAKLDAVAAALDAYARTLRDGDWKAHRFYHRQFHFGIYDSCGSPWLLRFLNMLWENSVRYQRLSVAFGGTIEQQIGEHARILAACRAGDAALAKRLTLEHIQITRRAIKTLVENASVPEHSERNRPAWEQPGTATMAAPLAKPAPPRSAHATASGRLPPRPRALGSRSAP